MVARVFYHGVRMKLKCKPKYNNYGNFKKKKVGQKPQTLGREAVDNEGVTRTPVWTNWSLGTWGQLPSKNKHVFLLESEFCVGWSGTLRKVLILAQEV